MDKYSLMYQDFKPVITAILNNTELSDQEAEAYKIFKTFDGQLEKEAAAPAILQAFYMAYLENTLGDELDSLHYDMVMRSSSFVRNFVLNTWGKSDSPWMDDVNTAKIEGFNDMVIASFKGRRCRSHRNTWQKHGKMAMG